MRTNELSKSIFVELSSFSESSKLAHYHRAVRSYLENGDVGQLNSYRGEGVTDSDSVFHPFEVDTASLIAIHERMEGEYYQIYDT